MHQDNPDAVVTGDPGALSGRAVAVRVGPDRWNPACPGGRKGLLT
jgi:hypothetical protein